MELFDLHCDTLCEGLHNHITIRQNTGHIDLVRGEQFTSWIQTFACWLPDDIPTEQSQAECFALLNLAYTWEQQEQNYRIIRTAEDIIYPKRGCNALLTVENGGVLGDDLAIISRLSKLGVRAITLTWNGDNAWASGCFGNPKRGLTETGRKALTEMETYGVLPDVSHINEVGFWDVLSYTHGPILATHAASKTIHDHPRNLSDEQFCAIRDRGGLVGLCLYPEHLGGSDMEQIRRHLEHFLSLNGDKTLCFGADFDGMTAPCEWNGVSVMKKIKQHLSHHGWTNEQLDAVFYTNARNFFVRHWTQTNKE